MAHEEKIAKSASLYFPSRILNQGGKDIGARCGKCIMFLTDTSECGQVFKGKSHKVDGAKGVCSGMFPGKPMQRYKNGEEIHPLMDILPQEYAGYIDYGPTYCGWCQHYQGDRKGKLEISTCSKVGLKSDPDGEDIEYGGCCNVFDPEKKALSKSDPKPRPSGGLDSLANVN